MGSGKKPTKPNPKASTSPALLSGGAFGKYVEAIETLEDLQGGRFPDPEPRRLQRNADRHDRPVFFIEPLADDEDWSDYLTQEARAVSHWRKLLGMVRVGKRWKKASSFVPRSTAAKGSIR